MIYTFSQQKLKYSTLFAVALLLSLWIFTSQAQALVTLNPNPGVTPGEAAIPAPVKTTAENCDNALWTSLNRLNYFETWISSANNPTTTVVNVPYGTPSLALQVNFVQVNCHNFTSTGGIYIQETVNHVKSTSTTPAASTAPLAPGSEYGTFLGAAGQNKGAYQRAQYSFTLTPPGGFTTPGSTTYSVNIGFTTTYRRSNGTYACVNPLFQDMNVAGHGDNNNCYTWPGVYTFQVVVDQPDVCPNIAGYQASPPPGYTKANGNLATPCLLPPPSCSPTDLTVNVNSNFTMSASVTNNASIAIDITSVTYGSVIAGSINNPADLAASGSGRTRTYNTNTHTRNAPGIHTITWTVGYGTLYGRQQVTCRATLRVRYPAPTPFCIINAGGPYGIGEQVTMQMTAGYSAGGAPNGTITAANINVGGTNYGPTPALPRGVSRGPGVTLSFSPITLTNLGTNNVAGSFTMTTSDGIGGTYTVSDTCPGDTTLVGNKSYLKVFGGAVRAGGGFTNTGSCSPATGGGVRTFSEARGTDYVGSSTQFTVAALLTINEFYSASHRTGTNTLPAKGLTFANTVGDPTYGGDFGASQCITDYYDETKDPTITLGSVIPASYAPGRQQYDLGSVNITLSARTIPRGSQIALFVDGDVFISGNIIYDNASRTSPDEIPNFIVVAKGNIRISSDVTRLDGLYIAQAQDDGTEGVIKTCVTPANADYTAATHFAGCSSRQLSINGGLIARDVKFQRVRGTLSQAAIREVPSFDTGSGTAAAEVINYTPEMWLAPNPLKGAGIVPGSGGSNNSLLNYDSFRILPPIY